MGTRVIRDGILESEAVLSLPPEGRWLYVSMILSADDYGFVECTSFKLARRGDVKREHVPSLLGLMVDADLVRLYTPDPNSPRVFGVITKFGQRLRGYRARCPLPPIFVVADQGKEFLNEYNNLASKKSDRGQPTSAVDGRRRPETETDVEKEKESLSPSGLETLVVSDVAETTPAEHFPRCPTEQIVELWHKCCAPPLPTVGVLNAARRTAISARWREVCAAESFALDAGLDWFRWLFAERVASSSFLMGKNQQPGRAAFRCSLDWLMRPSNFAKTVDGNYADRKGQ